MRKAAISILVILVVGLAGFIAYMGLFDEWIIDQKSFGPWKMVYIEQIGNYRQTGKSIQKVSAALTALQVEPRFPLAVFYDDPYEVSEEELRSDVGFVLSQSDLPKIRQLSSEFKTRDFEKKMYVFTDFPVKNNLSYVIGPLVCYPRLQKYCEKMRLNFDHSIELYRKGKIYYLVPKEKKKGQ